MDEAGRNPSIVHLAEAIESKHRVRERLVRALVRVVEHASVDEPSLRKPDPSDAEAPLPDGGLGLALNPLGEYLLARELSQRPAGR